MNLSLIIPVYNRPDELRELLQSLSVQTDPDFEVVVVEDGSSRPSDDVVALFGGAVAKGNLSAEGDAEADGTQDCNGGKAADGKMAEAPLQLKYIVKPNSGPGLSRNEGAAAAVGDWLVFLDSDCIVPPGYVAAVKAGVARTGCEVFGGPDRAGEDFSPMQKAVSYSMTSFFTTGGIRGGGERMEKFHPRSFNMGISRKAFEAVGGFSGMRYGEDIDLSIRLIQSGYKTVLLKDAWVCHKRRTDMRAFFSQVYHSGKARIALEKRHPHSLKAVHILPALFTFGSFILLAGALTCLLFAFAAWLSPDAAAPLTSTAADSSLVSTGSSAAVASTIDSAAATPSVVSWLTASAACLCPLLLYALLIFFDSLFRNGWPVARLSVLTSFVQLWGYGCGFLRALLFK